MKKGFMGTKNSFIRSMMKSIPIAVAIVVYHLSRLFAHKGDGAIHLAMYNDFAPTANSFISKAGEKGGDIVTQKTLTGFFEDEFKDMAIKLNEFEDLTRSIHGKNTKKYKLIWGDNRKRFYSGSYDDRLGYLKALADAMALQGVPLGEAAVLDYIQEIKDSHAEQQTGMDKVGTDRLSVNALRKILIKKLNKNLGGLNYTYGDDDDCEEKVEIFFPLNLLGDRSLRGHYQMLVSIAGFNKVCSHQSVEGDKAEILVKGGDAWIALADNADSPITSGYLAKDGEKVIVDFKEIGDITKKVVVVTNPSFTNSIDLIFNIIYAKR